MNGSFWSEGTLDHTVSSASSSGLYHIVSWIVLYRLYRIISLAGSYRIGWIVSYSIVSSGSGHTGFYALAGYWLDVADGMDGLDGELVVQVWDGRTLSPNGTGATPWETEQYCHHWLLRGGRLWEVLASTNFIGAARTRSICVGEAK